MLDQELVVGRCEHATAGLVKRNKPGHSGAVRLEVE